MAIRFLTRVCILAIILGVGMSALSSAQSQKDYYPHQKSYPWQKGGEPPLPEEDQAQADQGAYQVPPPTGAMQGATREFGLSGGEIELPAMRLRLPRIRLPALSIFLTPPQMHTERGVAPMVQQFQNQIAVPTGAPPPSSQDQTSQDQASPIQKEPYQHSGMIQGNAASVDEIARIRGEMEAFENRLDHKLAILATAMERLVEERHRQIEQQRPDAPSHRLAPLPMVDELEHSAVRHSSYATARPMTPSIRHDLRRLPVTTPSVRTASTPRLLGLSAQGTASPRSVDVVSELRMGGL